MADRVHRVTMFKIPDKENQAKLKAVALRYDPNGVFQRLQPGYFKLDGAPATWDG